MTAEEPPLWDTVKGDFASAGGRKAIAITLLFAWMAFQWGPGNDIILPTLAGWSFDTFDDGEHWGNGVFSVSITAIIGWAFWAVTQAIDAVVVLLGLRLIPGITARFGRSLKRRGLISAYDDMKWSTRWAIAYATGVSALCLVDVFATERPGLAGRRSMIIASVQLAAVTVGFVVALVAAAAMVAARIPSTEDEAEVFIRYAKNPLTWLVIIGSVFVFEQLRGRRSRGSDTEPSAA